MSRPKAGLVEIFPNTPADVMNQLQQYARDAQLGQFNVDALKSIQAVAKVPEGNAYSPRIVYYGIVGGRLLNPFDLDDLINNIGGYFVVQNPYGSQENKQRSRRLRVCGDKFQALLKHIDRQVAAKVASGNPQDAALYREYGKNVHAIEAFFAPLQKFFGGPSLLAACSVATNPIKSLQWAKNNADSDVSKKAKDILKKLAVGKRQGRLFDLYVDPANVARGNAQKSQIYSSGKGQSPTKVHLGQMKRLRNKGEGCYDTPQQLSEFADGIFLKARVRRPSARTILEKQTDGGSRGSVEGVYRAYGKKPRGGLKLNYKYCKVRPGGLSGYSGKQWSNADQSANKLSQTYLNAQLAKYPELLAKSRRTLALPENQYNQRPDWARPQRNVKTYNYVNTKTGRYAANNKAKGIVKGTPYQGIKADLDGLGIPRNLQSAIRASQASIHRAGGLRKGIKPFVAKDWEGRDINSIVTNRNPIPQGAYQQPKSLASSGSASKNTVVPASAFE